MALLLSSRGQPWRWQSLLCSRSHSPLSGEGHRDALRKGRLLHSRAVEVAAEIGVLPARATYTVRTSFPASPDRDVSRRGGDVGPHRHLEDQTDHLLFFCHLSSRGAKHYSHASWSLRSPCGIC